MARLAKAVILRNLEHLLLRLFRIPEPGSEAAEFATCCGCGIRKRKPEMLAREDGSYTCDQYCSDSIWADVPQVVLRR